jgi:hypothetical protein
VEPDHDPPETPEEALSFRRIRPQAGPERGPVPAELEELRLEIAILKERLAAVQALAEERLDRVEDLRLVLGVLRPLTAVIPHEREELGRGPDRLPGGGADNGDGAPESPLDASAPYAGPSDVFPTDADPNSLPPIWLPRQAETPDEPLLVEASATKTPAATAEQGTDDRPLSHWIEPPGDGPPLSDDWMSGPERAVGGLRRLGWLRLRRRHR